MLFPSFFVRFAYVPFLPCIFTYVHCRPVTGIWISVSKRFQRFCFSRLSKCQNSKHFEWRSIDQNRWKSGKSWKSCKFSSAETLDSRSSLRYLKTLGNLESLESLGSLGGVWLSILWIYEIEFDALKLLNVLKVSEILDFQVFKFTE